MVWNQDMDNFKLQEIAAEGVLHHKPKSRESIGETRKRLWKTSSEEKKQRSAKKSMEFSEKAIERKQQLQEEEKNAREEDGQEQNTFLRQLEAIIQQQTAYTVYNKPNHATTTPAATNASVGSYAESYDGVDETAAATS